MSDTEKEINLPGHFSNSEGSCKKSSGEWSWHALQQVLLQASTFFDVSLLMTEKQMTGPQDCMSMEIMHVTLAAIIASRNRVEHYT